MEEVCNVKSECILVVFTNPRENTSVQSRSWLAEQGKEDKKKSGGGATPATLLVLRK